MDRREFIACLSQYKWTADIIAERKDTGSLPSQIECLKLLWKIHKTIPSLFFVKLPYGHIKDGQNLSTILINILWAGDEWLILQGIEELGFIEERFDFIKGNRIFYNKLPETFNFYGKFMPIIEIFRLELPEYKEPWFPFEDVDG